MMMTMEMSAQRVWHDPMKAGFPVIQNQAFGAELSSTYNRLPERAKDVVRKDLWLLSRSSAGLAIDFRTDAPEINVRYVCTPPYSMAHMPATGTAGVDLYRISSDGEWQRCWGSYSFGDTISYSFVSDPNSLHNRGYEYRLYLPNYKEVTSLKVGIPEGCSFRFLPVDTQKPIVVYGTSIAQGACASRPSMAWTSILQRQTDMPLVNLGFSGNGRLEPEMMNFISEIDASLYILDCLPNLLEKSDQEVSNLVIDAVAKLRSKHPSTPILLIEHIGNSNQASDSRRLNNVTRLNNAQKQAYDMLLSSGDDRLYYISREEIGMQQDDWVDYIHPSDLGMQRQADAVGKIVKGILKLEPGNSSTTKAVVQRREPATYEWRDRHETIKHYVDSVKPRRVLIGNSITHYWGGEPRHERIARSVDVWNDKMLPLGYANLGCGWDRVENALWRVEHGELDGFEAEEVAVMIGTNNCELNTTAEVADGILHLVEAIGYRQPKARIRVVGILPRRGKEKWVKDVNNMLSEYSKTHGYVFVNPGENMLKSDGTIDETLFVDGLHPNAKGYAIVAEGFKLQ